MRSNGNDGERFSAQFSDDESRRHDSEPPPERLSKAAPPKQPRARKASTAPKSVAAAESKKAPAKRAKAKAAPKSRRMPAAKQAASPSIAPPPPSTQAPISMDPRTTLRDHPGQQSAARAVRAAVSSMRPPPRSRREDEISIPPTSSDPPGDLDDRFFADGEAVHREHVAEAKRASLRPRALVEELETRVPVLVVPPERRKKLTNYVKLAVGFSAFLCLAAGIRVGVSRAFPSTGEHIAAAAQVSLAAPPPVAAAPVAAPPPAPVAEAPAAAPEEPVAPTKSAKEEKEDARRLLEHGKAKDAIEAGERSVALDPTDAEAWLILGSAQQDAGRWKEGRESYNQCVKQAKVGPIGECRMMLH